MLHYVSKPWMLYWKYAYITSPTQQYKTVQSLEITHWMQMDALHIGAVMMKETSHVSDSQSNMRATHLQSAGTERPSCIWLVEYTNPTVQE